MNSKSIGSAEAHAALELLNAGIKDGLPVPNGILLTYITYLSVQLPRQDVAGVDAWGARFGVEAKAGSTVLAPDSADPWITYEAVAQPGEGVPDLHFWCAVSIEESAAGESR